MNFFEFANKQSREEIRRLKILSKIFEAGGFKTKEHFNKHDPHIFIPCGKKNLTFEGIRVYPIGNMIAFRVQKLENTEPYGKAYQIAVEDIFNDLMSENIKIEEAGKKTAKIIVEEVQEFFNESFKAEQELANSPDEQGLVFRTGGSDYSGTLASRY